MSRWFKMGFWAVAAGQLALLLAFIGVKEHALRSGTTVVLQAAPVDPRSLLQGDYAALNYEISALPPHLSDLPAGTDLHVTLVEGDEVWEADTYSVGRPSGDRVFIKGTVGRGGTLDFGIGTYFVPEGTGRIIEGAEDVKVRVVIDDDGGAVIKQVLVNGKPFDPAEPATLEPHPAREPEPAAPPEPPGEPRRPGASP